MDVHTVNTVLVTAISTFQEDEIAVMAEAIASGVTSYDVRAPGTFGMKSPKKGKKGPTGWSGKTIKIRVPNMFHDEGHTKQPIKAYVKGVWAVHKSHKGTSWVISHATTGMSMAFGGYEGTFFDRKKDAQMVVDQWVDEYPELMTIGKNVSIDDEGGIKTLASKITNYAKKLGNIARSVTGHAQKRPPAKYQGWW